VHAIITHRHNKEASGCQCQGRHGQLQGLSDSSTCGGGHVCVCVW
jgi:hypothetical protein